MSPPSIRWAFNWKEWNPSRKEFLYAVSCLQLHEKDRIGKFVFRKDVRSSLAGRLLMRKYVNECTGIPYNEIVLTRDAHGKPILENSLNEGSRPVNFNISHQGSYTVLAGEERDLKLGVDVMKLEYTGGKPLPEFFRIMNRTFSSREWDEVNQSPSEDDQVAMFCRHWALKESYVKAIGVGVTIDLKTIEFQTKSKLEETSLTTDTIVYVHGEKEDWLMEESLIDSEHCVAVALQENGKAPVSRNQLFEVIDFNKLMENAVPLFPEDVQFANSYFTKEEKPQ